MCSRIITSQRSPPYYQIALCSHLTLGEPAVMRFNLVSGINTLLTRTSTLSTHVLFSERFIYLDACGPGTQVPPSTSGCTYSTCCAFYLPTDKPLTCENIFLHCAGFSGHSPAKKKKPAAAAKKILINYLAEKQVTEIVLLQAAARDKSFMPLLQRKNLDNLNSYQAKILSMRRLTSLLMQHRQTKAIREQITGHISDEVMKTLETLSPLWSCATA